MEFYKTLSAQIRGMGPGLPMPVMITTFANKSFTFVMKLPPATVLIKKIASIRRGSTKSHTDKISKIIHAQAEEIAKTENANLAATDLDVAMCTVAGNAHSMGIMVKGL